jgi:altronate dehydratase
MRLFEVLTVIVTALTALGALGAINQKQDRILHQLNKIMATLDDLLSDVTAESTLIGSVSALITSLQQQVSDALSGTTLPPAVQSKVDAVFNQAEANKAALTAALTAGTPASSTPPDQSGTIPTTVTSGT